MNIEIDNNIDLDKSSSWKTFDNKKFQDRKKINNKNLKKILCHNIITYGSCGYGSKCLYAHCLNDQNIDTNRNQAYEILLNNNNLSNIYLQKDHVLYRSLLGLTRMCEQCEKNKCTGGYNCKFGACAKKYHICSRDLNYGDCHNNCECVHLSSRGLKPFYNSFIKNSQIQCTLLSFDFFKKIKSSDIDNNDIDILSEISNDSINNDNLSDECNQSIFDSIII